jgi:hypothetical protein
MWHYALKHNAESQPPLSNELLNANSGKNLPAECHKLRGCFKPVALHGAHLSAECCIRVKSSPRHFTSRVPLFETSYLFAARLLEYKTRRIV